MKPKFKKGDTVIVIGGIGSNDPEDRFSWIQSMDIHIGKIYNIKDVIKPNIAYPNPSYRLDDFSWGWQEKWLKKIKFKKGDTVIVIGPDGIHDPKDRFSWIQSMDIHIGKIYNIKDVIKPNIAYPNPSYRLDDVFSWGWQEKWLKKIPEISLEDDLFEL